MKKQKRRKQRDWGDNPSLSQLPLTEAQKRLLDKRIAEHEANPDDVEPWETAREQILAAARQRIHKGEGIHHEEFWKDAEAE